MSLYRPPGRPKIWVSPRRGKRRAVGSFAKRLARANKRSRRVRKLAQVNGGAKRLFAAGADPQQSYEAEMHGAAPNHVVAMRRNAVQCVAPAGTQACTASLLAWRLGPRADPAITAPVRQARMWIRLWRTTGATERKAIARAWRTAHPRILLQSVRRGLVSGLLQATVATLCQLGWAPISPSKWLTPNRNEMADLGDAAPNCACAHQRSRRGLRRGGGVASRQ